MGFPQDELGRSDDAARPTCSDRSYYYPHAWQPVREQPRSQPWAPARAGPTAELLGPGTFSGCNQASAHAVIGDELRRPAVWCELGSCSSRFTDAAALGESDVRSRALAVGWRQDALSRLACPGCAQHDPTFRSSYPLCPGRPAVGTLITEPRPSPAEVGPGKLDQKPATVANMPRSRTGPNAGPHGSGTGERAATG
jgi:hypothetical protein